MSASVGQCPGVVEIERLAGGDGAAPGVTEHLESCEACRQRLEAARSDAQFLTRVRDLSAPTLAPEGAPRLAGYRVTGVVSTGAQGVVYRAVQESTSRAVAIKSVMTGGEVSSRQRMRAEREAEIAARLRHPNIVTVFESRTLSDGRIAVVMEYVDGVPLDAWKPPGDTAERRREALLRVCVAACSAVHHAHLNAVIHRDLKPDNILVTPEGRPVVLDFGIAKAGGIHATMTGEFAGTPAYASPEQASGRADLIDALTDVYALGVILYRLVCGAMPYELSGDIFAIARTIGEAEPVPPRVRDPGVPADLEAIVLRAMQKDKARRYQSAAALARDIEHFLAGEPVDARSGSGWYVLRKAVALNRKRLAWAGVGVVMAVGASVAVALSLASAAESARKAAEQREAARAENVRARAVTELLREALPDVDPAHPELAGIIGAGLSRLYYRLESGAFAGDPDVDQALRRLWGQVYTGLGSGKATGLIEYAEDSLRNGLVRLRREHGPEHHEIAATMHDLAGVLLLRQRLPEAEHECRAAIAMRQRLPGPADVPIAESRALLARILYARGLPAEAAREADLATGVLGALPAGEGDLPVATMSALRGRAALEAHDPVSAEPLVTEALGKRLRHLPPEHPDLVGSLGDSADVVAALPGGALAAVFSRAWQVPSEDLVATMRRDVAALGGMDRAASDPHDPTKRTRALMRLLRLGEEFLGPDDAALVGVLIAQIRAGRAEWTFDPGADAALRAADILARRFGENDFSVLLYVEQAMTYRDLAGRSDDAAALAGRACRIWESVPAGARDVLLAGSTRRRFGWYTALAGHPEAAVPELRRSMDEIESAVGREHRSWALAESTLAYCLGETGDLPGADAASAHALALAERLPATPEDQLMTVRFVRGHVLRLLHRNAEAMETLTTNWRDLLTFTTPASRLRRVCAADVASASDALGDHASAEAWRHEGDAPAPPDR